MMFFFFFKQKTAYEMRISDWSSDVCSSDLRPVNVAAKAHFRIGIAKLVTRTAGPERIQHLGFVAADAREDAHPGNDNSAHKTPVRPGAVVFGTRPCAAHLRRPAIAVCPAVRRARPSYPDHRPRGTLPTLS